MGTITILQLERDDLYENLFTDGILHILLCVSSRF